MYCITYLCFIVCLLFHYTVGFAGYQFLWGLQTWREMWFPAGWFSLAFVQTLSLAGLVSRQLVPSLLRNNRHSVAWPCLPRSWNPPTFRLRHCLSLRDCRCVPWFGTGCFRHMPPTLSWLTQFLQYSSCGIHSRHYVPLVSIYIVKSVTLYVTTFIFMAHPSVQISVRTRA